MAVTPTAHGYSLNGQWFAPTEDFGYGQNPYDPNDPDQAAEYAQWQFQHQGDAQQIGQDFSPGRVGAIIGGTVAGGALGDYFAGAGGAAGVAGGGAPASLAGPAAVGLGPGGTLAGGAALPGAASLSAAPAAASLAPTDVGTVSGFGPEYASTGAAAAHTTAAGNIGSGALTGAAGAGAGSTFLSQLARYIGPAASVAQAVIGNRATTTARDQLVNANTQAQRQLHDLYQNTGNTLIGVTQRQQQNLQPFSSLGAGAAGLLGAGFGVPVAPPPTQPFVPKNPFDATLPNVQGASGFDSHASLAPSFQPGVSSPFLPDTSGGRMVPPGSSAGGGAVPRSGGAIGGVRMQAPTGEIAVVDPAHVAEAQARGAKLVN